VLWSLGRWVPSLVLILAGIGVALPTAAGAGDHPGIACPSRPTAPAQSTMTPSDPHAVQTVVPAEPGRPPRTAVATFALGWFWGVDSQFGGLEGVLRTTVGYTGGTRENPTYERLGDHTEAVEVEYDPAQISYGELLRVFWSSHDPRSPAWARQYRNAIFYHTEEQRRLALASRTAVATDLGEEVATDIEPAGRFYPAEDYHQKYVLRGNRSLWAALLAAYPSEQALLDSTVAARLNGYLGGYGVAPAGLADRLDLPPGVAELLPTVAGRR
jgi:peptide-methionine (S)-S-oxide reductase